MRTDLIFVVGTIAASMFAGSIGVIVVRFMDRGTSRATAVKTTIEAEVQEAEGLVTLSDQTVSLTMRVVELTSQVAELSTQIHELRAINEAKDAAIQRLETSVEGLTSEVHGLRAEFAEAAIQPRTKPFDF